jgi:hypothetical protein
MFDIICSIEVVWMMPLYRSRPWSMAFGPSHWQLDKAALHNASNAPAVKTLTQETAREMISSSPRQS